MRKFICSRLRAYATLRSEFGNRLAVIPRSRVMLQPRHGQLAEDNRVSEPQWANWRSDIRAAEGKQVDASCGPGDRKIGRCRLAVIRTTTLRLPVLAAPLQLSLPPLRPPSPPPIAFPFQPAARARPLHHPRPCCALSVSPFRSLPATISVSRLIKRRKLANEISIRNTLIGVVSPYPSYSSRRSANIPVPGFVVVCSLPLTWLKFDLRIVEKLQKCFSYDATNLAPGLTVLDRMPRIMRGSHI